jgi:hypothetical protein
VKIEVVGENSLFNAEGLEESYNEENQKFQIPQTKSCKCEIANLIITVSERRPMG